jgi:hypothetical protein
MGQLIAAVAQTRNLMGASASSRIALAEQPRIFQHFPGFPLPVDPVIGLHSVDLWPRHTVHHLENCIFPFI